MKLEKVEDGLQDFNCPFCDTPLEDCDINRGEYSLQSLCPECKNKILIHKEKVIHYEYSAVKYWAELPDISCLKNQKAKN